MQEEEAERGCVGLESHHPQNQQRDAETCQVSLTTRILEHLTGKVKPVGTGEKSY